MNFKRSHKIQKASILKRISDKLQDILKMGVSGSGGSPKARILKLTFDETSKSSNI